VNSGQRAASATLQSIHRLWYRFALAWMPLGFALWLIGMHLRSYEAAAGGIAMVALGAFAWHDDQHPDHPGG
jgi:hypothetical protein